MTTLQSAHRIDAVYFGDRPEWIIAASVHLDSDTLTRSNWSAFVEALGGESATVAIERSSHWAVGWIDYLVIDPSDTARIALVEQLQASLEDYPVLDEQAWSALEYEEYAEAWRDYGASEFCRQLGRTFGLCDATKNFLSECDLELLQEFFESCISSGEYYIAEGSGVSVNIDSAIHGCTREMLAAFLRQAKAA